MSHTKTAIAIVAYISLLLALLLSSEAFGAPVVLRNWFGSNFAFDTTLRGSTRYFDLDNIGCDFKAYTDSGKGLANDTFNIELRRDHGFWYDGCGSQTAARNGSSHFDWYGVGSGDYYFYFSKTFDGQVVRCDAMGIYSW